MTERREAGWSDGEKLPAAADVPHRGKAVRHHRNGKAVGGGGGHGERAACRRRAEDAVACGATGGKCGVALFTPVLSIYLSSSAFFFEQGSESDRILEARWARESGSTF